MQLRFGLILAVLGLPACGDKGPPDSGSHETGTPEAGDSGSASADSGGSGGSGGTASSDQPPTMSDADAWCYAHETGEARWIWQVVGNADDPQGIDTLEPLVPEGVVVLLDGSERARLALACDATGACSASFDETEAGVACADATRTSFELRALDEDGNLSEPAVVTGRQQ